MYIFINLTHIVNHLVIEEQLQLHPFWRIESVTPSVQQYTELKLGSVCDSIKNLQYITQIGNARVLGNSK